MTTPTKSTPAHAREATPDGRHQLTPAGMPLRPRGRWHQVPGHVAHARLCRVASEQGRSSRRRPGAVTMTAITEIGPGLDLRRPLDRVATPTRAERPRQLPHADARHLPADAVRVPPHHGQPRAGSPPLEHLPVGQAGQPSRDLVGTRRPVHFGERVDHVDSDRCRAQALLVPVSC